MFSTPKPFNMASNLMRRRRSLSSTEGKSVGGKRERKETPKSSRSNNASRRKKQKKEEPDIIDLCSSSDEDENKVLNVKKKKTSRSKKRIQNVIRSVSKEWICKACTFNNAQHDMVCAVCKTKKPISAITPHQSTNKWTCKGCTWVNPRKFLRCEMCEAKRPIASKSPLERTTPKVSRPTVAKTIESSTERPKRKLPMERKVQNSNLVPKDDSFALRMKIERLEKKLANKNRLIENLKKSLIKLRASQVTKPSTGIFGMPSTQNANKKKTTKKRRATARKPRVYNTGVADAVLNDELMPIQGSLWEGVGITGI